MTSDAAERRALTIQLSSFANPLRMLSKDKNIDKETLKAYINEMLSVMHDFEVGQDQKWETDAFFLATRHILLKTIEDKSSDDELKKLCL